MGSPLGFEMGGVNPKTGGSERQRDRPSPAPPAPPVGEAPVPDPALPAGGGRCQQLPGAGAGPRPPDKRRLWGRRGAADTALPAVPTPATPKTVPPPPLPAAGVARPTEPKPAPRPRWPRGTRPLADGAWEICPHAGRSGGGSHVPPSPGASGTNPRGALGHRGVTGLLGRARGEPRWVLVGKGGKRAALGRGGRASPLRPCRPP